MYMAFLHGTLDLVILLVPGLSLYKKLIYICRNGVLITGASNQNYLEVHEET
jgi:hypothetical protein